jgi:hypothetical protein
MIGPGRTMATSTVDRRTGAFQARQHRHLRATLDLEDADGVGPAIMP